MQLRVWHILFIVCVITILHISAILFGWYDSNIIWIDNIEHILAGIALSMLFIMIDKDNNRKIILMLVFVLIT
ncbi:MAG: hypothetical protein AABY16_00845, partial [Nanoarchaeota archaeon]